jgi:uncharacterized membrane protein
MSYHLDACQFSLMDFKQSLTERQLVPSRRILLDDMDAVFDKLNDAGLTSLAELLTTLKNKSKLDQLAAQSGIAADYLNLLRREASSYLPKPIALKQFSNISRDTLDSLQTMGLTNTKHFYGYCQNGPGLQVLAAKTQRSHRILTEILALSDLSRLYGVGPAFARLLYECGIQSVTQFCRHTPRQLADLYAAHTGGRLDFSLSDMAFTLQLAYYLPDIYSRGEHAP